jgi:hypothetical protein
LPDAMRGASRVATAPEVAASRGLYFLDLQDKSY